MLNYLPLKPIAVFSGKISTCFNPWPGTSIFSTSRKPILDSSETDSPIQSLVFLSIYQGGSNTIVDALNLVSFTNPGEKLRLYDIEDSNLLENI